VGERVLRPPKARFGIALASLLLVLPLLAPPAAATCVGCLASVSLNGGWIDLGSCRQVTLRVSWTASSVLAGWVGLAVRGLNFHAFDQADLIVLNEGPIPVGLLSAPAGEANRVVYQRCFPTSGDDSHGLIEADAWVVNCEATNCPFPPADFPVASPPSLASNSLDCHWGHTTQCNG
jgi:hypothetical protein